MSFSIKNSNDIRMLQHRKDWLMLCYFRCRIYIVIFGFDVIIALLYCSLISYLILTLTILFSNWHLKYQILFSKLRSIYLTILLISLHWDYVSPVLTNIQEYESMRSPNPKKVQSTDS